MAKPLWVRVTFAIGPRRRSLAHYKDRARVLFLGESVTFEAADAILDDISWATELAALKEGSPETLTSAASVAGLNVSVSVNSRTALQ